MADYQINNYSINVKKVTGSVKLTISKTSKTFSLYIHNYDDTYANTTCENNVTLMLNTDIYDFITNCLDRKDNYSYNIVDDGNDYININFIFSYGIFKFEYIVNLDFDY